MNGAADGTYSTAAIFANISNGRLGSVVHIDAGREQTSVMSIGNPDGVPGRLISSAREALGLDAALASRYQAASFADTSADD